MLSMHENKAIIEASEKLAVAIDQDAANRQADKQLLYVTIPALEDALRTAEIGAIADHVFQTQGACGGIGL